MPELSHIQTYEKLNGDNYRPILDKFKIVLLRIGLWREEVKKEFEEFVWKVDDDGLVYSSIQVGCNKTNLSDIPVRPLLLVYTQALDGTFKDNWICCDLLIETKELQIFLNGQFHINTYDFIRSLTFEMQREFKYLGVYFTDEAQDGSDFDGIRCKDPAKLWQFDYALIPNELNNLYSIRPEAFKIKQHENYLEVWNVERWSPEVFL
jgi:hypothetical protein